MPRATRNTNEYSGNEVSAPPNPNTWLKHKALTPRVAANESTTVLVRIAVPAAPAAAARRRDLPRPPATASTKGSGCRLRPGDLGLPEGDFEYIEVTITDLHYDTGAAPPEGRF